MTSAIAMASPAATMMVCFLRPASSRRRYVQYMGLLPAGEVPAVGSTLGRTIMRVLSTGYEHRMDRVADSQPAHSTFHRKHIGKRGQWTHDKRRPCPPSP